MSINEKLDFPKKPKICIVSEFAYPLLTNNEIPLEKSVNHVGGAELQMVLLAKKLAERSYDVTVVTMYEADIQRNIIDGIKVVTPFGLKQAGYTYFSPRNLFRLLKILEEINADIFVQRAATPLTGILALYARLARRKFLFSASSDANVSTHLQIKNLRCLINIPYRFGVKYSHAVVCQTQKQRDLLKLTIGRDSIVIKNAYDFTHHSSEQQGFTRRKTVLWVGRVTRAKQPELFLRLATWLPDIQFQMVAAPSVGYDDYYDSIRGAASDIKNLDFLGFLPHSQVAEVISKSAILVSTSNSEGFPNTFLEAWGTCTPVISLNFDPDGAIQQHGLGLVAKNFEDLVEKTVYLLNNLDLREKMGLAGRRYVETEHSIERSVDKYERLFTQL